MAADTCINKEALLNVLTQNAFINDQRHDTNIIAALGGMKNILTMILSSKDIELNRNQLIELDKIFNTRNQISRSNITRSENQNANHPEWTHNFNTKNTYLHHIFGGDQGDRIFTALYSKTYFSNYIIISMYCLY